MVKNKKILVLVLAIVLIGVIGGTVAYFSNTAELKGLFKAGTYQTRITEYFESPTNWTPGTTTPKTINVTNRGNVDVAARAKIKEIWTAVDGTDLTGTRNSERVALINVGEDWEKGDDGYYYYTDILTSEEVSSDFITSVTFNPNFELEEGLDRECIKTEDGNKATTKCSPLESGYAGAKYTLEVTIETIQADQAWNYKEQNLYNVIAKQASLDTNINVLVPSNMTNTNGVYTASYTKDEAYPVHYFRGNIDNNNVLFGGYCWQIVRTTETGGVKLVYNGEATVDGRCIAEGEDRQIGTVGHNSNSIGYAGYMYNKSYAWKKMLNPSGDYTYGNSFEYKDGKYILKDTVSYSTWEEAYQNLSNYHYTCFNTSGDCGNYIMYIYHTNSESVYYIYLYDGETIEEALNEMLWTEDVNKHDSLIKVVVDDWYEENMTNHTSYLEDTVWCSDRTVYSLGGWNPNGGTTVGDDEFYLYFGFFKKLYSGKITFDCPKKLDSFTVDESNGNGKLTYPVGILSGEEVLHAGGTFRTVNNNYYLNIGTDYYLINPGLFDEDFMGVGTVDENGSMGEGYFYEDKFGVRPSISLKPGIDFVAGDGTADSPYIIKTK